MGDGWPGPVIGQTRRAGFEQRGPVKEIARTLTPGATLRLVIGRQAAEFKYERGVQPRIPPAAGIAPVQRHRRGDVEFPEKLARRPATARP